MILSLVIAWVVLSGIFFASLAIAASSPIPPMDMSMVVSNSETHETASDPHEEEYSYASTTVSSGEFGPAHS